MCFARLASHAVSVPGVIDALAAALRQARAEIEDFSTKVHHVPEKDDEPFEYYVIERRRTMVEVSRHDIAGILVAFFSRVPAISLRAGVLRARPHRANGGG